MIKSVLVDSREPEWVQKLNFNAPTMVTQLDCSDLWISTDDNAFIVVERKEPNDLLGSIADGRLFDQADRVAKKTPWAYLVVTGPINPLPNGKISIYDHGRGWVERDWLYASIWGALGTVQEIGCRVWFCNGRNDFLPCMVRLAGRNRDKAPAPRVREFTPFGGAESFLAALPGIGPKRALELLRHFPTPASALWYLSDPDWQGERITGISTGIQQNIMKVLGGSLILKDGGNNNE